MYFNYSASGTPLSMTYNGANYYYVTSLQGDVIAILNSSGTVVTTYLYDAWGNILSTTGTLSTTVGRYNPLRYRGYIYDTETKLYYLQTRYYNPETGRFINADGPVSTGQGLMGNHMFAYCGNNPIVNSDASGMMHIREAGLGGGFGKGFVCGDVGSYGGGYGGGGGNVTVASSYYGYVGVTVQTAAGVTLLAGTAETIYAPEPELVQSAREDKKEVYDYSQALMYFPLISRKSVPRVHHIVPAGKFSNRNALTVRHINELHKRLRDVGIDRFTDPMNLLLVSAGTHSTLHTNAYIAHVHDYIMSAAPTKQGVYGALFQLRIEIAAMDPFAMGY